MLMSRLSVAQKLVCMGRGLFAHGHTLLQHVNMCFGYVVQDHQQASLKRFHCTLDHTSPSGTTSTSLGLACACLWAAFAIACPAGRPYSLARTHVWLNARLLDTPTSPYPTPLHPIPPHRTHPTPSQPPHSTSPHPTPRNPISHHLTLLQTAVTEHCTVSGRVK